MKENDIHKLKKNKFIYSNLIMSLLEKQQALNWIDYQNEINYLKDFNIKFSINVYFNFDILKLIKYF